MNWTLLFQYFTLVGEILGALQGAFAAIAAKQSYTSPPINTYVESEHGGITLTWTPLP